MILSQFYDIEISCVIRKFLILCKLMCFLFFRSIRFDGIYIQSLYYLSTKEREKGIFLSLQIIILPL